MAGGEEVYSVSQKSSTDKVISFFSALMGLGAFKVAENITYSDSISNHWNENICRPEWTRSPFVYPYRKVATNGGKAAILFGATPILLFRGAELARQLENYQINESEEAEKQNYKYASKTLKRGFGW